MKTRRLIAAIAGALAITLGDHANAAVMELSAHGDWNADLIYQSWTMDVIFDAANAVETPWTDPVGTQGHQLTISNVSATATFVGYQTWRSWLGNFDNFTPIPNLTKTGAGQMTLFQSADAFVAATPFGYIGTSYAPGLGGGTLLPGELPFADGLTSGGMYNYLVGTQYFGTTGVFGQQWTYRISLQTLPIPEPGTWTTMLVGLFTIGGALRSRRWTLSDRHSTYRFSPEIPTT